MAFFYHYLPGMLAEISRLDEAGEIMNNGPVSSTLIYLILRYSREALDDIITAKSVMRLKTMLLLSMTFTDVKALNTKLLSR